MKLLPSVSSNAVLVFNSRSPYSHRGLVGLAVAVFGLLSLQVAQASAPLNVSVTSSVASGGDADFTFTSSSDLGAGSISWIQGIFNNSPDGRDACYFIYTAGDHRVYLSKDGASGDWIDSGVMGESRSISNSQCSIDLSRATITTGSTTLAVKRDKS